VWCDGRRRAFAGQHPHRVVYLFAAGNSPSPKPGTMLPYHTHVRGRCYDSAPCLLPARDFGMPVALHYAALWLAEPIHRVTSKVSQTNTPAVQAQTLPLNFSLRHEVAWLIVWHGVVTRPVVPSAVSYADVREGNDPYRACGHGTHRHPTGTRPVRGGVSASIRRRRGWRDGMVHRRELSINVVMSTKPKMLTGLSQTGHWSGYRVSRIPCHGHTTLPAEREHLTRPCQPCGTW
jgi:hypothetical protein